MLRLVVVYQLVLTLAAGPMLCCCAATRLVRSTKFDARATAATQRPQPPSCCGHGSKPQPPREDGSPTPSVPGHCPCKDSPAKARAVLEATAHPADNLSGIPPGTTTPDCPIPFETRPVLTLSTARHTPRSASLSVGDLLFVHHNLRC